MKKQVSLKDIAIKVGVSTALVSYVVNGQEKEKRVSAEMAQKIRAAARSLNYTPNQLARSLRSGSTKTIGLVVADIANPFFAKLARAVEDEANRLGYTVVFGSVDESETKAKLLIDSLLDRQVDGLIIVPVEHSEQYIRSLYNRNIPFILFDRYFPGLNVSHVVLRNYEASREAASLFMSKGYKRLGIMAYKNELTHMKDRVNGFVDCVKEQGFGKELKKAEIRITHMNEDMEKAFLNLVVKNKKIDAMLFTSNSLGVAALRLLNKYKIRVPQDLAIISYDHNDAFDYFYAPVSHILQPIEQMGKEALAILMEGMKPGEEPTRLSLKHKIIVRESSG